ncbi:SH3-like domain-containing protein [Ktedonobacter racemifer]|uniref:Nitrile hydratase beta subunit-like N-terminal domain-containing protein n=1 Tax=Ktedonobacter racemifer DSM 44963 TaxID=485913 RepID=D6TIN8_KTERA|nr:SH3-like domain-containing protein [Ktedonobacter racemifer]EFH89295.1 conserved hypothetical protein [Ktedonobacter racemifer DSM 44963]
MISTKRYDLLMHLLDDNSIQRETTLPEMDHKPLPWETYMQATCECLDWRGSWCNKDRRAAEDELGETLYSKFPHYAHQALVAAHVLLDKGLITVDELNNKMQEIQARLERV